MDIAIIGAGNVGSALARSLTAAGHSVTVTATKEESARQVAEETGARAVLDNREAVGGAEVVVLAVPGDALDDLAEELGGAVDGKVVVDATNRMDMEDPSVTMDGTSNAEQVQAALPNARVVKAFNTAFAARQADPELDGTAVDLFVAGDEEEAKRTVIELAGGIGFRPIDAGSLGMARALEAMATLLISVTAREGWSWQDGWKLVGPTASGA